MAKTPFRSDHPHFLSLTVWSETFRLRKVHAHSWSTCLTKTPRAPAYRHASFVWRPGIQNLCHRTNPISLLFFAENSDTSSRSNGIRKVLAKCFAATFYAQRFVVEKPVGTADRTYIFPNKFPLIASRVDVYFTLQVHYQWLYNLLGSNITQNIWLPLLRLDR